jgi:hypothetical protein
MRKVLIEATVHITLDVDEGVEIDEILAAIEATSSDTRAEVTNFSIEDSTVVDSK